MKHLGWKYRVTGGGLILSKKKANRNNNWAESMSEDNMNVKKKAKAAA